MRDGTLVTFHPGPGKTSYGQDGGRGDQTPLGRAGWGPYALYAYSAANVVLQGMARASPPIPSRSPRPSTRSTWETPLGMMKFDDKNDPQQSPPTSVEGGERDLGGNTKG